MKVKQKYGGLLTLGMLLLLMAACSIPGIGANKSTLTLLQSSDSAMKQLKTAHVVMNMTSTSSLNAGSSTQTIVKMKLNGDVALPDQSSTQLTLSTTAGSRSIPDINVSMIMAGQKLYIQNSQGKWYLLDNTLFKGSSGNPFAGSDVTGYNKLLALAQKATVTDRGTETLNGASLHHVAVTFGKESLADLLKATGQNLPSSQQADLDQLMRNINVSKLTLDLWIDDATSYVHRMELKMAVTINGIAAPTTGSSGTGITSDSDIVIDYSKFNEPVTITAPADATPSDNLLSIFR